MSRWIDDAGHVAWGAAAAGAFAFLPWAIAAPLVLLPREIEQTRDAMAREGNTFLEHVSVAWALRKLRDLAGFAIGGGVVGLIF